MQEVHGLSLGYHYPIAAAARAASLQTPPPFSTCHYLLLPQGARQCSSSGSEGEPKEMVVG